MAKCFVKLKEHAPPPPPSAATTFRLFVVAPKNAASDAPKAVVMVMPKALFATGHTAAALFLEDKLSVASLEYLNANYVFVRYLDDEESVTLQGS